MSFNTRNRKQKPECSSRLTRLQRQIKRVKTQWTIESHLPSSKKLIYSSTQCCWVIFNKTWSSCLCGFNLAGNSRLLQVWSQLFQTFSISHIFSWCNYRYIFICISQKTKIKMFCTSPNPDREFYIAITGRNLNLYNTFKNWDILPGIQR